MDQPSTSNSLRTVVLLAALYGFGPLFLLSTSPERLPLVLLVVPFVWMFITLYVTVWLVSGFWAPTRSKQRRILLSATLSSLPVLLMVFQSLHQLTIKDVLLTLGIVLITAFYLARADFIR